MTRQNHELSDSSLDPLRLSPARLWPTAECCPSLPQEGDDAARQSAPLEGGSHDASKANDEDTSPLELTATRGWASPWQLRALLEVCRLVQQIESCGVSTRKKRFGALWRWCKVVCHIYMRSFSDPPIANELVSFPAATDPKQGDFWGAVWPDSFLFSSKIAISESVQARY